ncbi:hypothetical protein ACIBPB_25845 [Micromonospora sp. NPDC049836]|uniref:hypothetical protein n=1 Tax=Micromonospora sp. NPDC049836 TaxID=3364274 RepID=UPI0037888410
MTGPDTDAGENQPGLTLDASRPGAGAEQQRSAVRVSGWLARAAQPFTAIVRRPLGWAACAVAALSAAYLAWTVPTPVGFVVALALPVLLLRLPVTGLVLVAVLAQEIKPNGRFGVLTTFGYQGYFGPGKIPVILPLVLTAVLAAAARWWPAQRPRLRSAGGLLLGLAAALVVVSSGVGLLAGQSVFSAVNQNSRPFVLLLLGLAVGLSMGRLRDDRTSLRPAVGAALVGLLVAAAVAIPLGEIADDRLSAYFVYYDSALPAIAAAVLIGLLGQGGWRWDWRHLSVTAAAPLLVLISFRRSVWLAAVVALVVVLVLTWRRWRLIARQLAFAAAVVAVVVFAAPGFAADLGLRSVGSFTAGTAEPAPNATPSAGGGPGANGAAPSSGAPNGSPAPAASRPPNGNPKPATSPAPAATGKPGAGAKPGGGGAPTSHVRPDPSGTPAGTPAATPPPSRPAPTPPAQQSAAHQAESTSGHLSDLRLGWDYVRADPWTGVGPLAPQLPGLAAHDAERVYVHNELLQVWLRYGPLAPLLVVLFLAAAALLALRALRDPDADGIVRSAAAFCLITPLCVMTAPFLSETSRWPLVAGLAAGIVAQFLRRGPDGRPTRPTGSSVPRRGQDSPFPGLQKGTPQ